MEDGTLELDCKVTYDSEKGIEIRLNHGGNLSRGAVEHLARAGEEILLAFEQSSGTSTRQPQEKVRTKIEID